MRQARSGCWPNQSDGLLIKVALSPKPESVSAWESWIEQNNLDDVSVETQRLLPLVYEALRKHGVQHPALERMKGVYRYHSAKNQLLMSELGRVVELFHANGIEALLLKGSALNLRYYERSGLRPMSDCDVLVRPVDRDAAFAVLGEAGFSPFKEFHQRMSYFGNHGFLFQLPNGVQLDLHWFAISQNRILGIDDEFWREADTVSLAGQTVKILAPGDQLLQLIAHGLRWCDVPAIRWVVDCLQVLKIEGARIDWQRLLASAEPRQLMLPLSEALNYLAASHNALIPEWVLTKLLNREPRMFERVDYQIRALKHNAVTEISRVWCDYLRINPERGSLELAREFLPYLRDKWGLERMSEVPVFLMKRRLGKLHRVFQFKASK